MRPIFFFLLASSPLAADVLVLDNGGTIDGRIVEVPEGYIIDAGYGVFSISKDRAKELRPGRGPVHEFNERLDALSDSSDPDEIFALAQRARDAKITRHLRPLLQRVLEIDPDHEGARAMLDHVRLEGTWMPRVSALRRQGYQYCGGSWIPADQCRALLQAQAEERRLEEERAARRRYEQDVREFYRYVYYRATGLLGAELRWPYDRQPWSVGHAPWYGPDRPWAPPLRYAW